MKFVHYERRLDGYVATIFWYIDGVRHQTTLQKTKELKESKQLAANEMI
jgi:hypothetical protein